MGLSAQQLAYLRNADQRFRAKVGLFAAYAPTIARPTAGLLAPRPMPMCSPRYSLAALSEAVTLYGTDSYNRGGAYVGNANITFALNAGSSGTLVDNGDGTATYTAPGAGSGTAQINVTVTNANGSRIGYAFVQYPDTTYDTIVAEIANFTGSLTNNGWKALVRLRGDASGFTVGKGILLHIEDTWAGTASTFGGYKYSEGVFFGYITQAEYYQDGMGQAWLGLECQSPWWFLERMRVGETWWGTTNEPGKMYISSFAPMDSIWHFVNSVTNFSQYHNCTLFYDQNVIDDFIIDESDLGTIIDDVVERTVCVSYCDRYGSLFCIPDPDVRSAEWWGTPAPVYDSAGAGALTTDDVIEYDIIYKPPQVQKLLAEAIDSSKLGLWAVSVNSASGGTIQNTPKLICDQAVRLAAWCVDMRAQLNRPWGMTVTVPLNHVVDLCNFVDVNFTAPELTNGLTASGRTWISEINYRPDIYRGGWMGQWSLLKRTYGDGAAETGAVSGWGGPSGFTGVNPFSGSAPDSGGWGTPTQSGTTWCWSWDWTQSHHSWSANSGALGIYGFWTNQGWTAELFTVGVDYPQREVYIYRITPQAAITGIELQWSSNGVPYATAKTRWSIQTGTTVILSDDWSGDGAHTTATSIVVNSSSWRVFVGASGSAGSYYVTKFTLKGTGANPISSWNNCT